MVQAMPPTSTVVGPPSAAVPGPRVASKSLKRMLGAVGFMVLAAASALAWRVETSRTPPPVHYQTAVVDHGPIAAKVTASGTLSALVTVSVGSQVSGRIDSIGVDFESQVKRGQVVATIEPSLFRAAVAQARASFAAAKATREGALADMNNSERQYERSKALVERKLIAEADFDTAEATAWEARSRFFTADANVALSRATLDQATLNLKYTTIVSPIDGVVISRNIDVGQTVAATLQAPTLFTIAQDLTHMQVDTNVAEADIGKIRAGMHVLFTVDAYPQQAFPGTVRQVRDNAQSIQNVVTYDAVIDVDNGERLLKPGMTASVTFVHARRQDVTRVPIGALRFRPDAATLAAMTAETPPSPSAQDERVIWVLRAGRAVPVLSHVGISDGTWTELVTGAVRPGDLAIVEASVDAAKR